MTALRVSRSLPLLLLTVFLAGCDSDNPLAPTEVEGKFVGEYIDSSTCITPAAGSWPLTIWLYDYVPETGEIKVALRWDHEGSLNTAHERFAGSLASNGRVRAYALWSGGIDEEYEIDAMLYGDRLAGRYFEHCGDGTADIWEFDLGRDD
jgi:hypothetical protein